MNNLSFNKKGSTSVFLLLILSSFLIVIGLFVSSAKQIASQNYVDSVLDLAGRSILSEYNLKLKEDYGIFAFKAEVDQVENKLKLYTNYSFNKKERLNSVFNKRNIDPLGLELQSVNVNLKEYSITNVDILESQILEYMKFRITKSILFKNKKTMKIRSNQIIELKNKKIINSLPSQGYSDHSLDISKILEIGIPSFKEIKDKSIDSFYLNQYILDIFQNRLEVFDSRRTFFYNEVEYIISGKYNDEENYSKVRTYLILLRAGLNLTHIYSDSMKRNEVIALAEIITPGPGAIATQLIIASTWAGAEAENDVKLLEDCKNVPFIKTRDTWALDLEGVMKGLHNDRAIEAERKTGQTYKDYLRLFLFLMNRETKLLRCMDLIQLNMKGNYNSDFDIKDYYGGFYFEAMVQDKKNSYVHKY